MNFPAVEGVPMNARHHRAEAERLLAEANGYDMDVQMGRERALVALGKAQVHATLAASMSSDAQAVAIARQIDAVNASTKTLRAKVEAAAHKGYLAGSVNARRPY